VFVVARVEPKEAEYDKNEQKGTEVCPYSGGVE